jgi:hypothetical protein
LLERDQLRAKLQGVTDEEVPAVEPSLAPRDSEAEILLLRNELVKTRAQLAELDKQATDVEKELIETRNDLLESWQQVKNMRKTVSWRLTAPLRSVRRARGR